MLNKRSASCPNSQPVEEQRAVRIISTSACLAACCGLGQTALRKLRQRAQLVEHKFFERVVRHEKSETYSSTFVSLGRYFSHHSNSSSNGTLLFLAAALRSVN